MLDYVNSINRKRGVTRLSIVCLALSCFLHFCAVITLFLFPQLLAGGYFHNFRGFRWGTAVNNDDDNERWRMVAVLEPPDKMNMPSPEMLRKILGVGDREEGAGTPPVDVRFGPPDAPETQLPPLPKIPRTIEEPEIVIPVTRKSGEDNEVKPDTGNSGESPKTVSADAGTGSDTLAAKPAAAPEKQIVENAVPQKIPETIPSGNPPPAQSADVAAKKAGSSGSDIFIDTYGFPMGDYKEIIEGLVKSRWLRPSNIKGSYRKTTVVFYINKNGRTDDLRVEVSSGNRSLDTAALGAILGAGFPPLPKGFPKDRVGVRMILIDD